jgi:hypothetical protein
MAAGAGDFGPCFGYRPAGGADSGGPFAEPIDRTDRELLPGQRGTGEVSSQPIGLSLDEAIQRGLKTNLGIILSGTQTAVGAGPAAEPVAIPAALGGCKRQGNRVAD